MGRRNRRKKKEKFIFTTNEGDEVEFSCQEELDFMESISEDLGRWMQFFAQMGVDLTRVSIMDFYSEMEKLLQYALNPEPGKKISVVHDKELGYFTLDILPLYSGYLN